MEIRTKIIGLFMIVLLVLTACAEDASRDATRNAGLESGLSAIEEAVRQSSEGREVSDMLF
ncbi:hypothetical protein [Streptococcus sp. NLN76]|uniref:hypothetical protein n=1 Tax=Streptococcus sp. NLN76 TaxID=2822800 RepID=UPI0018A944AC|nr:hypothetical protein [Streptococcus sp. NLN76]MBF8970004.1 hypothetical protein [Streptococcus sp. NLN76]